MRQCKHLKMFYRSSLLLLICFVFSVHANADITLYVSTTYNDGTAVEGVRIGNWSPATFGWPGPLLAETCPTIFERNQEWWQVTITANDCDADSVFHGALNICAEGESDAVHNNNAHRNTHQTADIELNDGDVRYVILHKTAMRESSRIMLFPDITLYVSTTYDDGTPVEGARIGNWNPATFGWPGQLLAGNPIITASKRQWWKVTITGENFDEYGWFHGAVNICAENESDAVHYTDEHKKTHQSRDITLSGGETLSVILSKTNMLEQSVFTTVPELLSPEFYVVGQPDNIFGCTWINDIPSRWQMMTWNEDSGTFTWTSRVTKLYPTDVYFKMYSKTGDYELWVPGENLANLYERVTRNGFYTLSVTYNPGTGEITHHIDLLEEADYPNFHVYVRKDENTVGKYVYGWVNPNDGSPRVEYYNPMPGKAMNEQNFEVVTRYGEQWYDIPVYFYMTDNTNSNNVQLIINDGKGNRSREIDVKDVDAYIVLDDDDWQDPYEFTFNSLYVVGNNRICKNGYSETPDVSQRMTNRYGENTFTWSSQPVYLAQNETLNFRVLSHVLDGSASGYNNYPFGNDQTTLPEEAPAAGLYILEVTFTSSQVTYRLVPCESAGEHHYIYVRTTYKPDDSAVDANNNYIYNTNPETFGYWPGTKLSTFGTINRFGKTWYAIPILPGMTATDGIIHAQITNGATLTKSIDVDFDTYVVLNKGDYSGNRNDIFGEPKYYVMGDNTEIFGGENNGVNEMLPNDDHTRHNWFYESIYLTGGSTFHARVYREQVKCDFGNDGNGDFRKNTVTTYYPSGENATLRAGGNGSYVFTAQNTDATAETLTAQNTTITLALDADGGDVPGFYVVNDANWQGIKVMKDGNVFVELVPTEGTTELANATVKYTGSNNKYTIILKNAFDGHQLTLTGTDGNSMVLGGFANKRIYYTSHNGLDTYSVNGKNLNNLPKDEETENYLPGVNPWAPNVYERYDDNQWQDYTNLMTTADNVHYTWTSERTYAIADAKPELKVVKNGVSWFPDNATGNVNTANGFPADAKEGEKYLLKVYYTAGEQAPTYEWLLKRPAIYVYDFASPKVYVSLPNGDEPNGAAPGKNVLELDFSVGGTRGTNATADGTTAGVLPLGWYKYELPAVADEYTFKLTHVADATVIKSDEITVTDGGDAYVYYTNTQDENGQFVQISKDDARKLHRIVVHVLAESPTLTYQVGENAPETLENPSSFYGKLYFWQAFTVMEDAQNNGGLPGMKITIDGVAYDAPAIYSDVYFKLSNTEGQRLIAQSDLDKDLADKPGRGPLGLSDNVNDGRGTVVHLLKNDLTPPSRLANDGTTMKYLAINAPWRDDSGTHPASNVGATWWGDDFDSHNGVEGASPWMGTARNASDELGYYYGSKFMTEGNRDASNYYTIDAYDGTEWYTWYCDRSVAIPQFTYAIPNGTERMPRYPISLSDLNMILRFGAYDQETAYPFHDYENMNGNAGMGERTEKGQVAGEVWLRWNADNSLIEVTRDYESRAYQKPPCAIDDPFGYGEENSGYYIYYTDINGWDEVFVQILDRGQDGIAIEPTPQWPGLPMSLCGYDEQGHPIYVVDLTSVIDEIVKSNPDVTYNNVDQYISGILFNDGGQDGSNANKRQSSEIKFVNGGCYDYVGLIGRDEGVMDLRGVWYSRVTGTLFAKGTDDYNKKSVNVNLNKDAAHDIVVDGAGTTMLINNAVQNSALINKTDYDQSNWYELRLPQGIDLSKAAGEGRPVEGLYDLVRKNFRVVAKRVNKNSANPMLEVVELLSYSDEIPTAYPLNPYIPANFNAETTMQRTSGDNDTYFFVEPKPCELAVIYYSVYDPQGGNYFFSTAMAGFPATIDVAWDYYDPEFSDAVGIGNGEYADYSITSATDPIQGNPGEMPYLYPGYGYSGWLAVIKLNETGLKTVNKTTNKSAATTEEFKEDRNQFIVPAAPAAKDPMKYIVYPIRLDSENIITAIDNVKGDTEHGTLVKTRYYNLMGIESGTPFQGVNIVVKEYSDGSKSTSKIIQ